MKYHNCQLKDRCSHELLLSLYMYFLFTTDQEGILITPWFKMIASKFLFKWWNCLKDLDSLKDTDTIHRML